MTVTATHRSVSVSRPPEHLGPDNGRHELFIHKLGDTRKEPSPVTRGINAANSEGLKLVSGLLVSVSATMKKKYK